MSADPVVVQVSAHVWAIPLRFGVPTPERLVHAYLIRGSSPSGTVLVDCGTRANAQQIVAGVRGAGVDPAEIDLFLATHEHADHVGAALELTQTYGWPIAAHRLARRWIEDADLQARERPLPHFDQLMGGSVPVQRPLVDGEVVHLGDCQLTVVHTPGHSVGSLSLVVMPDNVIISGDVIIQVVGAPFYDDPAAVRVSMATLRALIGPDTQLLSSHAPVPSRTDVAALDATLAWMDRLDAAVAAAWPDLAAPIDDDRIRQILDAAGWTHAPVNPVTRITIQAHRRSLMEKGMQSS